MSAGVTSSRGVTLRNVCAFATSPSTRPKRSSVRSTSANARSRSATSPVIAQHVGAETGELGGGVVEAVGPTPGDGEARALAREVAGDAPADAARRARHDHDPAGLQRPSGAARRPPSTVSAPRCPGSPSRNPSGSVPSTTVRSTRSRARPACRSQPELLLGEARARLGRPDGGAADFGDDDFVEPFRARAARRSRARPISPCSAAGSPAGSSPGCSRSASSWPTYLAADPGVRDERIAAPIVVTGAPRTGTTLLYGLLACDPRAPGARGLGAPAPRPAARPGHVRRRPAHPARRPSSCSCPSSSSGARRDPRVRRRACRRSACRRCRSRSAPRSSSAGTTCRATSTGCSAATCAPPTRCTASCCRCCSGASPTCSGC